MLKLIKDILFPKFCVVCGRVENTFCKICSNSIHTLEEQECLVCSHPSKHGITHKICSFTWSPKQHYSMFRYQQPIKKLLRAGKYSGSFKVYKDILSLFNSKSKYLSNLQGATLIPIPISQKRLRGRGYNQSYYICQYISELIPNAKVINALVRTKDTQPQYGLTKIERAENLQGVFAIGIKNGVEIKDKDVVIVDDICTTGATLLEACKTLSQASPKSVKCLTIAKDL